MKINFNKIIIKKKLGAGTNGITYLSEYKNKTYALKIEKMLNKFLYKNNYENPICREIDFYQFIDTLPKSQQLFFTKLYGYEINDTTNFTPDIMPNYMLNDIQQKKMDSKWTIKWLIEYKGKAQITNFLYKKKKITFNLGKSIILQILNFLMIIHKEGYIHNDLNPLNIMINTTDKKTFIFDYNNKKILYSGYQISVIDYGEIFSIKFKLKNNEHFNDFIQYRDLWLFKHINIYLLHIIIMGQIPCMEDSAKKKKYVFLKKDWLINGYRLIITNHLDFYNSIINKYINLFPKGKKLIQLLYDNANFDSSHIKAAGNNYEDRTYYLFILYRIIIEFSLYNPHLYIKYFNFEIEPRPILPKNYILELLLINNTDDFINYLITN